MTLTIQQMKEKVSIRDILKMYAFIPDSAGYLHCPFHEDRHASFKVYEKTNSWYCFSCNRGGDIFQFIMDYDRCNYWDAIKKVQDRFNLEGDLVLDSIRDIPDRKSEEEKIMDEFNKLVIKRNYFAQVLEEEKPYMKNGETYIPETYAIALKMLPIVENQMEEFLEEQKEKKRKERKLYGTT